MKVCLVTATKNRHRQLERLVRFVLDQTYDNWVHLIFNNAKEPQRLNNNIPNLEKFILINNSVNIKTHHSYKTLGEIYTDAMRFVPKDADVITFMDDDDIFLENHLEEGIKGLEKGGLLAYKPQKSYYKHGKKTSLVENTLEPSIFVKTSHVREHGFSDETTAQHLKWVNPLIINNQIFVDPQGKATYVCDWSQEIPTFKTSGDPHNPNNFQNYTSWSQDAGDGLITPCSKSWANHYRRI